MEGVVPGAESSLRAHLGELDGCWLRAQCGQCLGETDMPFRLMIATYGRDHEVGAIVARLKCKRCHVPPSQIWLRENANDVVSKGSRLGWSRPLIDRRPIASAPDRAALPVLV